MKYTAKYFDGLTGTPHIVTLRMIGTRIKAVTADKKMLFSWPSEELQLLAKPKDTPTGQAILAHIDLPDARLYLDAELYAELAPHLAKNRTNIIPAGWSSVLGLAGVAIAFVVGLIYFMPAFAGQIAHTIPKSWEESLGEPVFADFVAGYEYCENTEGKAALAKIMAVLVETRPNFAPEDLTLTVLDTPEANAVAIPGGYITILSGLIDLAEDESELVGVLAHELAHLTERHGLESIISYFGFTAVITLITGGADMGVLNGAGHVLLVMRNSRASEAEADRVALDIMKTHDLDPRGLATFFARMQDETSFSETTLLRYFSTHPPLEEREARANAQANGNQTYKRLLTDAEWQSIKSMCK